MFLQGVTKGCRRQAAGCKRRVTGCNGERGEEKGQKEVNERDEKRKGVGVEVPMQSIGGFEE